MHHPDIPIPVPESRALVVTMDQRASRKGPDLVEPALVELNERYAGALRLPFERTTGDEMQAVAGDAGLVVDLVLRTARLGDWWIGLALGGYDPPMGSSPRESRGEAFYMARNAVNAAKETPWGFAFASAEAVLDRVERCLIATSWIVRKRTARQQEAVDLLRTFGRATRVAMSLGISDASVSERLAGAGVSEENAGRELARDLLAEACGNG